MKHLVGKRIESDTSVKSELWMEIMGKEAVVA
jgi:hypothetical protein